jgi:hypothetical protein
MENPPCVDDIPIKTPIRLGISQLAMFYCRMVISSETVPKLEAFAAALKRHIHNNRTTPTLLNFPLRYEVGP